MATNKVTWEFLLDQRKMEQGLKKTRSSMDKTKGKSDTLSKAMGGITKAAGILGLAVGAGAILKFGKDAITASVDYGEAVNAIEVATGDASKEIIEFGKTADKSVGMSETALLDAGVAFSGFASQVAGDGRVAETFEDYITRVADFGSVMNLTTDEAISKFQSALAGQSEPLMAYGINISAAATQTYALQSGIIKVGEAMTDDEKVRARYGLLMQETAKFSGDFARTSDEAAGKVKKLNAKLENSKRAIGDELMPAYVDMLEITEDLIPAIGLFAQSLTDTVGPIADVVSVVSDLTGALGGDGLEDGADTAKTALFGVLGVTEKLILPLWAARIAVEKITGRTLEGAAGFEKLGGKIEKTREAYARSDDDLTRYRDGLDDVTAATGDAIDAEEELQSLLQQADPVLDAISSYENLQSVLQDVDEDGERTKDELLKVAEATLKMQEKFDLLDEENVEDASKAIAAALGISEDAARELLDELGLIDGKTISAKVLVDFVSTVSGKSVSAGVGIRALASGGTMGRGDTALVGEEGPEIITAGKSLRVHPNGTNPFTGGGGGNTYNINITAIDPASAARAVADAIRFYESTNGPI